MRRYIDHGREPRAERARQVGRPSEVAPYLDYLRWYFGFPDLSADRFTQKIGEWGYVGAYTAKKRTVSVRTSPAI